MPAQNGKRTRLSDHDLAALSRERTPDEIAEATGIGPAHVRMRLRRLGLGYDGEPADLTTVPTPRKPVVSWYADGDEEWRAEASCFTGGHSPELWFAKPVKAPLATAAAKAICAACPVRAKCLDSALRAEAGNGIDRRAGIFGGLTVKERMALGSEAVA